MVTLNELCSKLAALDPKARKRYIADVSDENLGHGNARQVYGVGDFAVKLLENPHERFQQENDVAVMKFFADRRYIPQLYAYDATDFEFLIMERLSPLKEILEIPAKREIESLYYSMFREVPMLGRVLILELERQEHWGYSKDGSLKALDFGC